MHFRNRCAWGCGALILAGIQAAYAAPVGPGFTYQGRLNNQGAAVDGTCAFQFRLFDAATVGNQIGSTITLDGVGGNPPPLSVVEGLFTVDLDFGAGAINGQNRWLEIGVRCPANAPGGFTPFTQRQLLSATPHATYAASAGGFALPFAGTYAGTDTTAMAITQTGTGGAGSFRINNAGSYWEALTVSSNGTGPALNAIHTGNGYAGQFQNLNAASGLPAILASTTGTGSAINASGGATGYGVTGSVSGPGNAVQGSASGTGNAIQGSVTGNNARAGFFRVTSTNHGGNAVEINSAGNDNSQSLYALHTGMGDCGLFEITNAGSQAEAVEARTNGSGDAVQGINTGTGRAGYFSANINGTNSAAVYTLNTGTGSAGIFEVNNASSTGYGIRAFTNGNGQAGAFRINSTSSTNAALYSSTAGLGPAANFQINNANSSAPALIVSTSGSGPSLRVGGLAEVDVLEIQGGADLSEGFDVAGDEVQPGMVVVIDPQNPGQLKMSTQAYDRKVAGIVSGAGGVKTGMMMKQAGSIADGKHPVALTGRVWCQADATDGAIEPGDLLVTSETPGHAMKTSDFPRSQGAIIGKAMTELAKGDKGLVLVLVGLQ